MAVVDLIIALAVRMCVIATVAFVLTRTRIFRRLLGRAATLQDKMLLTLFFGLMGIAGTYFGIPIKGAIANSRVVAAAVAGLLGGPWVGLGAGLIAGVHRYFVGGFTGFACGLSTTVEGLLAGVVYTRTRRLSWQLGFVVGLIAETLQMLIILAVARPFSQAWELVRVIGLPMILVNAAGIAIFISMIQSIRAGEERIGALLTHQVLQIANRTLPYLRKGLDLKSAARTAAVIYELTGAAAVAITDREKLLAHVGNGQDHHRVGQPILTRATRLVLEKGEPAILQNKSQIGCPVKGCSLQSGVVVPLRCRDELLGTLKIYHTLEDGISPADVEFAVGMSQLFATQLELAELEKQAQLATKAELKALRAQINPHFLFNALNTIVSFCRTDPDKARELLSYLGDFFRRNLKQRGDLVNLAEELEHVEAYLAIEKARFGDRLRVIKRIDPSLLSVQVPVLTLQPLVENAIKHGLLPREQGGTVEIRAWQRNGEAWLSIRDDGVGIPPETVRLALSDRNGTGQGIGLVNVNERLKSLFGREYGLRIRSTLGKGTVVSFRLYLHKAGEPEFGRARAAF